MNLAKNITKVLAIVPLLFIITTHTFAYGALTSNSIMMSNSNESGTNVTYALTSQINNNQTIGSMAIIFCSNSPMFYSPCDAPSGFDVQSATISNQVGINDFTIDTGSTTANSLILTRAASPVIAPLQTSFDLSGVTNPDYLGTFYARIITYSSTDATGLENDYGGVALATTANYEVYTEVPPYLSFCVAVQITGVDCSDISGEYASLGNLSDTSTATSVNQFSISTNAGSGYNIYISGNTLTSGNNIISALSSLSPSLVGQSQFGINLRANTQPSVGSDPVGAGSGAPTTNYNISNQFMYINNDIIASSTGVALPIKYTVSYITNVSSSQAPGVYNSTFTYTGLANF